MQSKLSDLVDNLSEINKKEWLECKGKCEFIGFKNDRLHYRCKKCKKRCTKSKDGLIKKFPRIYKFCNGDLNKFVLLLRKGIYPYEYMDSWEIFDETSLPDKEAFYSELNLSIWNKRSCWLSWPICSKRYIIACKCIWKL